MDKCDQQDPGMLMSNFLFANLYTILDVLNITATQRFLQLTAFETVRDEVEKG
jgi:hypothetical protein